jgi:hypothetical protein
MYEYLLNSSHLFMRSQNPFALAPLVLKLEAKVFRPGTQNTTVSIKEFAFDVETNVAKMSYLEQTLQKEVIVIQLGFVYLKLAQNIPNLVGKSTILASFAIERVGLASSAILEQILD